MTKIKRIERAKQVTLGTERPSLCNSQVGSCNCFFGACSACTLTESPSDALHRKLRQLRCLRRRFDCCRVERTSSRAGVAPAEVQRLSRRNVTPTTARAQRGTRINCSAHFICGRSSISPDFAWETQSMKSRPKKKISTMTKREEVLARRRATVPR